MSPTLEFDSEKATLIPPFSEKALTGQVTCYHSVSNVNGITDNLHRHNNSSQYIVQRSLVTPDTNNRHPLILMNITSRTCKIQKGEIIGLFTKAKVTDNIIENDSSDDEDDESVTSDSDQSSTSDKTFYISSPDLTDDSDSDSSPEEEEGIINYMQGEDCVPNITNDQSDPTIDPHDFRQVYKKPSCLTEDQFNKFISLLEEYDDVFVGKDNQLGRTHLYTHGITLKPDAKPLQLYPFRMSPHKADLMEKECEKLVKQDILEETKSGPWSSRSFLVEKKGGQGYRLVTDLRYVNSQAITQALISPRADDSIEMIGEMKPVIFSKMDAQQGYFQIPIREEDRDITAFLTRTKKYRYKTMPMGLASSAQAFQAVVNLVLQNLQYKCAIPYLDDILCLSPSIDQHFIDLRNIFHALKEGNLKLKKTKCEFFLEELDFLGMKVTTEGLKPSPEKVEKIKTFPVPKNVRDVRSFTGLAQFYRKFIKGLVK